MDSYTLEGLTARLEAAERGLKAARQAIVFGSIVVLLVSGGAAWLYFDSTSARGASPKTIEAQQFIVRDAQGEARAALGVSSRGSMQLVFFQDGLAGDAWREHEENGPFSFGVRSINAGPQLVLNNRSGETGGFMATGLTLTRKEGGLAVTLISLLSGEAALGLADSSGGMHLASASALNALLSKPVASPARTTKHRRTR